MFRSSGSGCMIELVDCVYSTGGSVGMCEELKRVLKYSIVM